MCAASERTLSTSVFSFSPVGGAVELPSRSVQLSPRPIWLPPRPVERCPATIVAGGSSGCSIYARLGRLLARGADGKGKMKKFKFGELFKKATTSTGRPSRASTQIRRSYNEDVIAPSFAPEEDHGAPNASSFPCYEFLTNAGILDDFFTLVNRAGLATYVGDERGQYYRLTKVFVESFKFHNTEYEPTVAFKIYDIPVTMKLEEFCCALGIAPVGTARRIDDNPRDLLELYRGITGDDCRTIQRGKIRNIQLPAIKYFAYYIGTSILGRENTSNISSYHLAFLNVALTGETPYHLGSLIARRLSSRGPIFGGTIALRILTHLDIPLDSNDVPLTPRKLDIAAMKSHRFVTTDSTIDNMVYRMLFADGNEKEIPLPQPGLFNIDRQSWSLTKEAVEEHMKIQEFHQQHDSENAEPSYDYTVDTSPTNPSKEIFSELDETFARGPILHELPEDRSPNEVGPRGGREEAARPGPGRADLPHGPSCGPRVDPRLLKASSRAPVPGATIRKTLRDAAAANPISGIQDRLRHLPERGFISGGLYPPWSPPE
ncbi:hypothetical protein QYE76_040057 [Lolium multiflorum]|uniref:Arabidopsis retrotransposon Orf1 C-terminal domain-containing protein n=1 Tax=Lolium multiflorum TaxID=4521 RepID=A0AAD8TAV7_LOLMU|nr:hypothetical protein QYE76_040057 [Lolium multiflorum]